MKNDFPFLRRASLQSISHCFTLTFSIVVRCHHTPKTQSNEILPESVQEVHVRCESSTRSCRSFVKEPTKSININSHARFSRGAVNELPGTIFQLTHNSNQSFPWWKSKYTSIALLSLRRIFAIIQYGAISIERSDDTHTHQFVTRALAASLLLYGLNVCARVSVYDMKRRRCLSVPMLS